MGLRRKFLCKFQFGVYWSRNRRINGHYDEILLYAFVYFIYLLSYIYFANLFYIYIYFLTGAGIAQSV
jgi:hypothetical protein